MKYPKNWNEYELIDAGNQRKLERFGNLIVDRPEPAAGHQPRLNHTDWNSASHYFTERKNQKGSWNKSIPSYEIGYEFGHQRLRFTLKETAFKHLGIFPEQAVNWNFINERCMQLMEAGVAPKVLNLFAYTGAASVVAAYAGAQVTHVDSIKSTVTWANENAGLNNIDTIRWIVEDARKFVEKSIRRGDTYHGVIMDPPVFGLGPRGKHWKLNRDLPELLQNVMKIIHPEHRFFILNTYSPQLTLSELKQILRGTPGFPDRFESTTLGLKARSGLELELGNLIRF